MQGPRVLEFTTNNLPARDSSATEMAQSHSPLSPRIANLKTPSTIQKSVSRRPPEPSTFEIHSDVENYPPENHIETRTPSPRISQPPEKYKSNSGQPSPRKVDQEISRQVPLTEDALRESEGLIRAIDLMNGGDSILDLYSGNDGLSVAGTAVGFPGMDDTCFSTFSAVPNTDMTLFAQAGQSPAKAFSPAKRSREAQYGSAAPTPRPVGRSTPSTSRRTAFDDCSPSPTPRRQKSSRDADTTNLILDFTEQFNAFSDTSRLSPSHRTRPIMSKFNTQPDLASYTAAKRAPSPGKGVPSTPSRSHNLANLLDFDLPPAPTPRSIPTITARELESLKSSMLSQISNLRATLSGREAEVSSLKEAVTDAERRVGEAQEEIRDQRGQRETLQAEKEDWQARDKEMQSVLRDVKEEIIHEQHEHEKLQQRLEASEKKREEAEAKLVEADSKIAGLQAASAAGSTPVTDGQSTPGRSGDNAAVEAAVEKVARELHGLYKSKHETKVAALKKSYEARWERKIKDLEARINDLTHENEELRIGRDATMTGVVPGRLPPQTRGAAPQHEDGKRNTEEASQIGEQRARLEKLSQEIHTVERENTYLQEQLEKERLEMAELVKATEEMMQLSLQPSSSGGGNEKPTSSVENLRGSISKATMNLKPPSAGSGESRIGRMGHSGSGLGGTRSGIMSNIERMGRGRVMD
ncbi:MAG: hypothetical protein LQ345_004676 [Seirophora villosa]|nr:MAG: hypothetical protein LQ345_004676 [Seirophora villosa]